MGIQDLIKDNRQEILRVAESHGATNVRVFGSVARGIDKPGDLGLLVRLEPGYSLFDLIAIKQDLEDLLGCRVDVVTEAALSPYMREQVLQEAASL